MHFQDTFKKKIVTCLLIASAVLALSIFWRSMALGMFSLLNAVSFAIVGKGNRKIWLLISPIAMAVILAAPAGLLQFLVSTGRDGVLISLIGFILMTVLPGLFLVFSHQFGKWRTNRLRSPLHVDSQASQ